MKIIYRFKPELSIQFVGFPRTGEVTGTVSICISDVVIKIKDLSMGGLIPNSPCLASHLDEMQVMELDLNDPVDVSKVFEMASAISDEVMKIDQITRKKFLEPLLG